MKWTEHPRIQAATHGCPHHLDELVALALLGRWAETHGRRLDVEFLPRDAVGARAAEFDVLVDVGMQFDPSRGRFDHHQGGAEVAGKSSAGLVFDALYSEAPTASYLRATIRLVDRIDTGTSRRGISAGAEERRAENMLSLSTLLKAVGGFEPDPGRSRQCLQLVEALVGRWFEQAEQYLAADAILERARPVWGGLFLAPPDTYGPGLDERLQETDWRFVGYQQTTGRFQVVVVRGLDGRNRWFLPPSLPEATFVHERGFLAMFPDALTAEAALATLAGGDAPCTS
jgi:hypothetical protein